MKCELIYEVESAIAYSPLNKLIITDNVLKKYLCLNPLSKGWEYTYQNFL